MKSFQLIFRIKQSVTVEANPDSTTIINRQAFHIGRDQWMIGQNIVSQGLLFQIITKQVLRLCSYPYPSLTVSWNHSNGSFHPCVFVTLFYKMTKSIFLRIIDIDSHISPYPDITFDIFIKRSHKIIAQTSRIVSIVLKMPERYPIISI